MQDTEIDNANNVFVKTNKYNFFLEDLKKNKWGKYM